MDSCSSSMEVGSLRKPQCRDKRDRRLECTASTLSILCRSWLRWRLHVAERETKGGLRFRHTASASTCLYIHESRNNVLSAKCQAIACAHSVAHKQADLGVWAAKSSVNNNTLSSIFKPDRGSIRTHTSQGLRQSRNRLALGSANPICLRLQKIRRMWLLSAQSSRRRR
ncbi:hypothetical protein EJ03DRAFT_65902 [Teratosphaeria nubilosa]|uniref:Uncharacterized protein n=1 Tax=Teratosphaeria nubilosa TaxID=161662 RepID=A0A6G1LBR8_9PEZI|nr:hypothetical protein EJ03DRAFT_65902 [Teratosphaeria nubilosa]